MSNSKALGIYAEKIAAGYLSRQGYKILVRNFRIHPHEIDIIALHENVLIFVEVKARTHTIYGFPESTVAVRQQKSICCAAEEYMEQCKWDGPIRFDIISIEWFGYNFQLRHFEDAFY